MYSSPANSGLCDFTYLTRQVSLGCGCVCGYACVCFKCNDRADQPVSQLLLTPTQEAGEGLAPYPVSQMRS